MLQLVQLKSWCIVLISPFLSKILPITVFLALGTDREWLGIKLAFIYVHLKAFCYLTNMEVNKKLTRK